MVFMDMRKIAGVHELLQPLVRRTFGHRLFQALQADDADYAAFITDGPRAKFTPLYFLHGSLNRHLGVQNFFRVAHCLSYRAQPFLMARFGSRQVDTVLVRQDFINRLLLESRGNEKTQQVGNHQRHNDGVISRNFENHHYRCHWRADDARKSRTHSNQCISSRRGNVARQKMLSYPADSPSQHGSHEQARPENAAGIPGSITYRDRDEFQHQKQNHHPERKPSVQNLAHMLVTDAERLGHEPAHQSNYQSACYWLEPHGLSWKTQKSCPQPGQKFRKRYGDKASGNSEHRIDPKFSGMHQLIRRHLEQWIISQQEAKHRPGCCRGQHHGTEYRRVHIADYFFQRKQDCRERRVECSRNRRGSADRYQRLHLVWPQSEPSTKHRGDSRSYLDGGTLSS